MLRPNIKYKVTLSEEEREFLRQAGQERQHGRPQDTPRPDTAGPGRDTRKRTLDGCEDRRGVRLPGAGRWQTAQALRRGAGAEEACDPAMDQDRRGGGGADNRPDVQPAS